MLAWTIYYYTILKKLRILNYLLFKYRLFDTILKYDNIRRFKNRANYISINIYVFWRVLIML